MTPRPRLRPPVLLLAAALPLPVPLAADEIDADLRRYVAQMGSRNAMVSLDAVDYIPYFGPRAVPALVEGLRDPAGVIAAETARLKSLGCPDERLPKFHPPNVKAFAAAALGRIPDPRAVEPLIAALDDTDTYELNVLSDDGAELHPCYDSAQPLAVARHAAMALGEITGQGFGLIDPAKPGSAAAIRDRWKAWWDANKVPSPPPTPGGRTSDGGQWTLDLGPGTSDPGRPLSAVPPEAGRYPIPDHARYLRGVKICIDPGHGGDRWKRGYKRGPSGASEAEANLRVGRFLRDFLAAAGADVVLCRDSDADVPIMERPAIANRAGADLFVSIHHNWAPRYSVRSTTTWYHATPDYSPSSLDLARCVQEAVAEATALPDLHRAGGLMTDFLMYPGDGFGVLRGLDPAIPGVLCETTYYSNHEIERQMRSLEFNRRTAHGYFLGLARYLYLGIPRAELVEPGPGAAGPVRQIRLRLRDGLDDRREWGADRARILADSIRITVDGHAVQHAWDPAAAVATVTFAEPLDSGEHAVVVAALNVNKNHAWPKRIVFRVP